MAWAVLVALAAVVAWRGLEATRRPLPFDAGGERRWLTVANDAMDDITAPPPPATESALPQVLARRAAAVTLAWIALVAAGLWWIYYQPEAKELYLDEWQYRWSSDEILHGRSGNPYLIWPPATGAILAALRRWLGDLPSAILAMQLLHTLLVGLCAVLVADLGRSASGSRAAGVAAGLLFLAHPSVLAYSQYLFSEPPFLALLLLALWLPVRLRERPAALPWAAVAAGAAWGASLLFKSAALHAWPLWLLLLRPPVPVPPIGRWLPRLALHGALFLVAGFLVTVPARLESWRVHGEWVVADSSVFGLWVGLHDRWRSDAYLDDTGHKLAEYLASSENTAERRRLYRQRVRETVAERGMLPILADKLRLQPFRLLSAKTNLVTQLPGPSCSGHLPSYSHPPPALVALLTLGSHALQAATLVAFAFGIVLWRRWHHPVTWMLVGLLAYFSAVFLVGHVEARYAIWIWPFLCIFAGWFIVRLISRLAVGEPVVAGGRRSTLRWASAAALSVLLVWFAFAGPHLDRMCA